MRYFFSECESVITDKPVLVGSFALEDIGLKPVMKRRKLTLTQTKEFHKLEGEIDIAERTMSNSYQLASWNLGYGRVLRL